MSEPASNQSSGPTSSSVGSVGSAAVGLVSLILVAGTILMTRVAFFKTGADGSGDTGGFWHARIIEMTFIVPGIAAILFAHGLSWWRNGLRVRAGMALVAFPAWVIVLRGMDSVIANDTWVVVVLMQLGGIQPFGAPRS